MPDALVLATFMPAAVMSPRAMPATAAAIPTTVMSATGAATGEPDESRALPQLSRYELGNRTHKNGAADAPTSAAPGTSTRPVKWF
jgi:hypothetical protein